MRTEKEQLFYDCNIENLEEVREMNKTDCVKYLTRIIICLSQKGNGFDVLDEFCDYVETLINERCE